ncbi:hypothetical protein CY34DRAFT_800958 [Suillus luteus UH-Slu-Lm8-n1]|uniref:Uncharacterized protein n=1 Tax=Suillus luteus UH-Slu-Lm8-n1 TaxID=930992 RepID=A0A0D0BJ25_9AGAM|nr:hypothetical protein CY34DRAFT_800958 [Suillus luteus UH-Slu-Lm8-n1]
MIFITYRVTIIAGRTCTLPSTRGMSTTQADIQELPERVTKTSGTGGDGRGGKG